MCDSSAHGRLLEIDRHSVGIDLSAKELQRGGTRLKQQKTAEDRIHKRGTNARAPGGKRLCDALGTESRQQGHPEHGNHCPTRWHTYAPKDEEIFEQQAMKEEVHSKRPKEPESSPEQAEKERFRATLNRLNKITVAPKTQWLRIGQTQTHEKHQQEDYNGPGFIRNV